MKHRQSDSDDIHHGRNVEARLGEWRGERTKTDEDGLDTLFLLTIPVIRSLP